MKAIAEQAYPSLHALLEAQDAAATAVSKDDPHGRRVGFVDEGGVYHHIALRTTRLSFNERAALALASPAVRARAFTKP